MLVQIFPSYKVRQSGQRLHFGCASLNDDFFFRTYPELFNSAGTLLQRYVIVYSILKKDC